MRAAIEGFVAKLWPRESPNGGIKYQSKTQQDKAQHPEKPVFQGARRRHSQKSGC